MTDRRTSSGKTRTKMFAVLIDREGRFIRRLLVPRTTTFLLNIRDGHYYDKQPCCGRFMRRA